MCMCERTLGDHSTNKNSITLYAKKEKKKESANLVFFSPQQIIKKMAWILYIFLKRVKNEWKKKKERKIASFVGGVTALGWGCMQISLNVEEAREKKLCVFIVDPFSRKKEYHSIQNNDSHISFVHRIHVWTNAFRGWGKHEKMKRIEKKEKIKTEAVNKILLLYIYVSLKRILCFQYMQRN